MLPNAWLLGCTWWCLVLIVICMRPVCSDGYQTEERSESEKEQALFTLSDEKRLIKRLLKNYENAGITGRPVKHTNEKVLVNMSLSLIQILDLDEKNQVLTISVWLLYHWTDHILKWDPKNYSQVLEVRVPPKQVWTPDIVLYNYADERLKEMRDAMVIVQHDGTISWMPPAIFKSSCKIDIKRFPFDEQTCHMKFGSWTYDGNRLDMTFINNESQVLLDDYTESNEWEIIARPALRNVKYYPCCKEPYPDLTYFLFLRRNAAFFSYILVLPCVLLSSLTLVIFWLPPESPAKMVLGMNIFVAFFLLLLLLADSTPQASNSVPYIGYYYCLNMILITLSSFLSVIVINLYFRGDRRNRVPYCIRTICQILTGSCLNDTSNSNVNPNKRNHTIISNNKSTQANTIKGLPTVSFASGIHYHDQRTVMDSVPSTANTPLLQDPVIRKPRKVKTRFASPTTYITDTVATVPEVRALLSGQNDNGEDERLCHRNNRPHNRVETKIKLRSRSLTPAKQESNEPTDRTTQTLAQNSTCQLHRNACSIPVSGIRQVQTQCKLCHPNATTVKCCPCKMVQFVPTHSPSRHQRHPQSCQACLQHLNALRAHRTFDRDVSSQLCDVSLEPPQASPINSIRNPSVLGCSDSRDTYCLVCGHHTSVPHRFNISHQPQRPDSTQPHLAQPVSCDHPGCSQFRYEYRQGRLALIADELHGPSTYPEDTIDLCLLPNGTNLPRVVNGRLRVKEKRELIQITKTVEEEIRSIHQSIRTFLDRIAKKDTENVIVREWRMVAMVMDRIFFVCYLLIHLCAAFGLLVPSSQEADVVGFLREYRLKNYNAAYVDGEAMGLGDPRPQSGQTNSNLPRMDKPGTVQDRQVTSQLDSSSKNRVSLDSSASQRYTSKQKETDPSGLLALSLLSPYQRLVDEQSQSQAGMNSRSSPVLTSSSYGTSHSSKSKEMAVSG